MDPITHEHSWQYQFYGEIRRCRTCQTWESNFDGYGWTTPPLHQSTTWEYWYNNDGWEFAQTNSWEFIVHPQKTPLQKPAAIHQP